jgi:hypothetical protein
MDEKLSSLQLCSQTGVWEQAVVVYLKAIFQTAKMLQKILIGGLSLQRSSFKNSCKLKIQ